jgi:uncharacterized protein GlcG (DUF336 family)
MNRQNLIKAFLRLLVGVLVISSGTISARLWAQNCSGLPTATQLKTLLPNAAAGTGVSSALGPGKGVGGLFGGQRMWAAVVNRNGELCAVATSTADPTQVWPGSQAIAKAKAYTANAFSLDALALSTARLFTLVQPGHSLFGLNNSNPFDPSALAPPNGGGSGQNTQGQQSLIAGGIITFGGGVAVYNASGSIIGGLGVSGDTACTDHEIAKRVRDLAGLNPSGGPLVDDITYSSTDGASVFTHPVCANTVRNGVSIGNENPAVGY